MKTQNILFIPLIFLFISCGSKKPLLNEIPTNQPNVVQVIIPCTGEKYNSDDENFRGSSSGLSPDQATAKKIALINGGQVLATDISATFTSLVRQYTGQDRVNNGISLGIKYKEFIEQTIDQELKNSKNICEVTTLDKSTNNYTVYVAREINASKFFDSFSEAISKDEQLKLDYDYEKFKQEFEKEMERRRNQS